MMVAKLRLFFVSIGKRRLVFFFLSVIIILFFLLYFQGNKMEQQMQLKIQFIEEKNILRDELDDIIDEHDDLLDEYGELNEQLQDKDSLIQEQITEIRNLIRTKSDLQEARKKIEALKAISKKYIANIDSLLVLNEKLTIQKDSVISVNKDINWRNYKLNKKNEELAEAVNKGSVLMIDNIDIEAIKYKITGKEAKTKYAKKTQKIRVCFSVLANPIAKAEPRIVYMQLIDNNGIVVLGTEEIVVNIGDDEERCTDSTIVNYENIHIDHCFEWERVKILKPGYYLINLIVEDKVTLQSTFRLK